MSADEFDPAIERLFARSPHMPDAELFAAEVRGRLASSSRVRTLVLTLAGLVGGVIAVREIVRLDRLSLSTDAGNVTALGGEAGGLSQAADGAAMALQAAVRPSLEPFGLGQIDLTAMGGMPLFWLTAAALMAILALGAVRLSQEA